MTKKVKVLGTGCTKCKTLTLAVENAISKNNIDATVEKVEDITNILAYNVMRTPALVVDEKVVTKGIIPSEEEILQFLN